MSTDTQAKDLIVLSPEIETNFYATFKPSLDVSGSQVELNINGVLGATVHGRGFTPDKELKGKIRMQSNIAEMPNSYMIATVGNVIVFLFRARGPSGPIVGGATFPNPFENNIDWHGTLEWKHLHPIPPKVNGIELFVPNATADEPWQHAPITIRVDYGAVSRLVVVSAAGHHGFLVIDSDVTTNPPFPNSLSGTLWYKQEMFNMEVNSWQLTFKKPGGYYLTFAPNFSEAPNTLGYAHLDTPDPIVPIPGDWFGTISWVPETQLLPPPESNKPITLSTPQGVLNPVPTATVGDHVTDLLGLNDFLHRTLHTGRGPIELHGWIHIDRPGLLFGEGSWVLQVHQTKVPPGGVIFAVLTFYSNILVRDVPQIVGQATFDGIIDNPQTENPPMEWSGEYSWRSTGLVIDPPTNTTKPPKNLPLTAEIALILPYVGVGFRKITANFGGWSAILPDDFAKFFIYTPYEPPGLISPKVVAGTLLYEPSLTGVKSRWKVETVYGDGQAVMTLYSDLIGPLLPIGFAIFNGRFPAGSWEGTLEWERNVEDRADKPLTARDA